MAQNPSSGTDSVSAAERAKDPLSHEPYEYQDDVGKPFKDAPVRPAEVVNESLATPIGPLTASAKEPSESHWYSPVLNVFATLVPYGGLVSNVFSLCSVTLGGGIIGMADSFRTSGIVMAVIYLVVINFMTIYTLAIMGLMIQKTGARNWEETGFLLFGKWGGYFVGFVMTLSCVGTAISYVSAAGSLMSPILLLSPGTPEYLKTTSGNRVIVTLIWLFLLVPIIIPKRINSLRYVSMIGVTMVLYFVITIVAHSATNGLREGIRDDMILFSTGNQAVYALSIYVFSFMNQGIMYSITFEMRPRFSVKQLTLAALIACSLCTVFYILAGVFGYLDFGNDVEPSILYNYDPVHQPYVMVAYIGMLIKICAAFSMNMIPIRNYMYYCLRWDLDTSLYWKHITLLVIVSGIILVGGLFIPSINLAFGLVGSLCGGFIGFIFPALFWMYSGNWNLRTVGIWHYLMCYLLLVTGVIAIVWGTVATVYSSFFDTN